MSLEHEHYVELEYRTAKHILERLFRFGRFDSPATINRNISLLIEHINNMTSEPPVRRIQPIRALTMFTEHIPPDPLPLAELEGESVNEEDEFDLDPDPATLPPVAPNLSLENTQIININMFNEYCPNDCAICQEIPKYKDAIRTECNHYYCKTCWESWMAATSSNKKCPTCRKNTPTVTIFKCIQ
jgi:hypothetical protein